MPKWVTPNILDKRVRLGEIEIPRKADGTPKYTFEHLKHPLDSPWNLPDQKESLWITVPIDDELFKIAHYMDRNKSYRYATGGVGMWVGEQGVRWSGRRHRCVGGDNRWGQNAQVLKSFQLSFTFSVLGLYSLTF